MKKTWVVMYEYNKSYSVVPMESMAAAIDAAKRIHGYFAVKPHVKLLSLPERVRINK